MCTGDWFCHCEMANYSSTKIINVNEGSVTVKNLEIWVNNHKSDWIHKRELLDLIRLLSDINHKLFPSR